MNLIEIRKITEAITSTICQLLLPKLTGMIGLKRRAIVEKIIVHANRFDLRHRIKKYRAVGVTIHLRRV